MAILSCPQHTNHASTNLRKSHLCLPIQEPERSRQEGVCILPREMVHQVLVQADELTTRSCRGELQGEGKGRRIQDELQSLFEAHRCVGGGHELSSHSLDDQMPNV